MLTQHNRKTAHLSPDYNFAIHELGAWSWDKRYFGCALNGVHSRQHIVLKTSTAAHSIV